MDCNTLVAKLCKRVESWMVRFLNFAGRLLLIKAIMVSIVGYWSMYIFLPKLVLKAINRLLFKFYGEASTSNKGGVITRSVGRIVANRKRREGWGSKIFSNGTKQLFCISFGACSNPLVILFGLPGFIMCCSVIKLSGLLPCPINVVGLLERFSMLDAGSQNPSVKVSGNPWTGAKGPSNAWPGTKQPVSAREGQGSANANKNYQPAVVRPSLQHGWQWRSIMSQAAKVGNVSASNPANATAGKEERKYAEEEDFDTEDIYDSDEYDLDESQMSHETLLESSVLQGFFKTLDEMKAEEINEPDRQWHCPACYGGPGAIDWYRGLQALITHAKTKGKRRVKAHRVLAQLLDEELRRKGTSLVPAGEAFGKWKGLSENAIKDKQIVWPPMVIIMNTQLERDDSGKWVGMGSNELLEYFSGYEAVKARHSYGPQGHRGMSVLIFEASAVGYFEADRLSKRFEDEGTNRDAWDHKARRFLPDGQRVLYGYMAEKGDIDIFNQHSKGKSIVKFEMRSYEEMVVNSIRQMSEDNHLLNWYKNIAVNETKHVKTVKDSFGSLKEKLRKTQEENRIVRQRTKMHQQQHKEEMDSQEEFYKEQLKLIHEARNEREENFEKIQQEKRENMKIYMENPSSTEDRQFRFKQGATLISSQKKAMDNFADERDNLVINLVDKKAELMRQRFEEDVKLEKEFDEKLARLMEKYSHTS